jgi:hypothetical protein
MLVTKIFEINQRITFYLEVITDSEEAASMVWGSLMNSAFCSAYTVHDCSATPKAGTRAGTLCVHSSVPFYLKGRPVLSQPQANTKLSHHQKELPYEASS